MRNINELTNDQVFEFTQGATAEQLLSALTYALTPELGNYLIKVLSGRLNVLYSNCRRM